MVKRSRLIERIASDPTRTWLVEAGAGFGKSMLVNELRRSLPTPLVLVRRTAPPHDVASLISELTEAVRRAGLADLGERLGAADDSPHRIAHALIATGCSVVLDDLHLWSDELGSFVLGVADSIEAEGSIMLVLVGRDLPDSLRRIRNDPTWRVLGGADLGFDIDEVAELLRADGVLASNGDLDQRDSDLARSVHELTAGWPAAVAAVSARLRSNPRSVAVELARYDSLIDGLLGGLLDGIAVQDLAAGRVLAILPFFDDRVAELAGSPGLVTRLAAAGVPMTRQADGWTEMPEQFRSSMIRSQVAGPVGPIHPQIADYFVERGEIHAAITACLAVGDNLGAARIIANANYTQEAQLDPVALNAAMTTLGDVAEQLPRSLLVQAQVNVSHGAFGEGLACIERAARAAAASDPDLACPVHQEILLELGVWRHFSGETAEAHKLMQQCRSALTASGATITDANQARLLDLQGLLSTRDGTKDGLEAARFYLTEALAIWRRLQEPRAAAATVLRLVSDVLADLGRRTEAIALLDSLPAVGPMTLVNRARVQLQRARLLPYLGRGGEVAEAVDEARHIADLIGHEWLLGMAATYEAIAASFVDDRQRVLELCAELDAHPDRFVTGADAGHAWCLMTEALIRCGDVETATDTLAKARECEGVDEVSYEFASAALVTHRGDVAQSVAMLESLAVRDRVMPERRWSIALLRAVCAWHAGVAGDVEKYLQASFDEAAALDHEALPLIAEQRIVAQLRETARTEEPVGMGVPSPTSAEVPSDVVEVSLFGDFGVTVNGAPIKLPAGQITDLVKMLVLADGRLLVDQVVDQLWPEADLAIGRPRLRNVLKRLRKASDLLVDRSGEAIVLAGQVASDFARAERAAHDSLTSDASLAQVTQAVELNSHKLLGDDLYSDWAEMARRAHRAQLIRLLDRQADLAEQAGEIDVAVTALEAAHELDGTGVTRVRHAAALLGSVGRDGAATALARRHGLSAAAESR